MECNFLQGIFIDQAYLVSASGVIAVKLLERNVIVNKTSVQ
jgi:hypothetical protein